MSPVFEIKRFNELSVTELYNVLKLRSEVFVVEQTCIYPDMDGKDYKALHLIGNHEGEIVAYARLFRPGDYFENASIGRVAIDPRFRKRQWGQLLMQQAINGIAKHFRQTNITISAQLYLQSFYEALGFVVQGTPYDEDGIPHVQMLRS